MAKKQKTIEAEGVVEETGKDYVSSLVLIPAWAVDSITSGKSTRVICEINGFSFPCAFRPQKGGVNYMISLSLQKMKKTKVTDGMKVLVKITPDVSEYGYPMSEEFAEFLDQDPELKRMFDSLPVSYQRGWLYYIGEAKSVDTRIKRCLLIAERVREEVAKRRLGGDL